jgi:hypothetical protein
VSNIVSGSHGKFFFLLSEGFPDKTIFRQFAHLTVTFALSNKYLLFGIVAFQNKYEFFHCK